jgi:hypothetical protein
VDSQTSSETKAFPQFRGYHAIRFCPHKWYLSL